MPRKKEDIKVFISSRASRCDACGEELGSKAWINLAGERGSLCLSCADLDHLLFLKYSGRVGRSASAKALDGEAVRLAVIAHLRHRETRYDELLAAGYDRWEARAAVEETIAQVLQKWSVK